MPDTTIRSNTEVVLIGAGIMSATLGLILKELQPDIKLKSSRLDRAAAESSDAWNNAGTGHSAFVSSIIPERRMGLLIQRKRLVSLNL
jgi:malate dehydrogenase (quinone)